MRQQSIRFLQLGVLSLMLTLALALGACDTEEGGISDSEGAGMAENAGQGPESEEGVGITEEDGAAEDENGDE